MLMRRFPCVIFWSCVIFELLLCRSVWANLCHREEHFVKLEGEVFPSNSPIKITTTSELSFCSIECTEFSGCKSFAFLTSTNTDNCHLGPTDEGLATSTAAVVYKRKISKSIQGCATSPCLNGGTCADLCEEPYYFCRCPSHTQGDHCEHDIKCFNLDWWAQFDNEGTHTCSENTYMAGFKRSDCKELSCIEEPVCCPLSIEYSQSSMSCQNGRWGASFATNAWNWCPSDMLLRGLYRSGGSQNLGWLEEGVCCKPDDSPHLAHCYYEDISLSFDVAGATARCHRPFYYIYGIRTLECGDITCIEELSCCKFA